MVSPTAGAHHLTVQASREFIVYGLWTASRGIFYIGQGHAARPLEHRKEALKGCACYKCNVIRKSFRTGDDFGHVVFFRTRTRQHACDMERALIAVFGRKTLTNKTDGGEGNHGWTPSKETIERMKTAAKKRMTPEAKQRIAESLKGNVISPEQRAKQSASMKGRPKSAETRAKMAAAAKLRPKEYYQRFASNWGGSHLSDEVKQKISQKVKGFKHTPEARAKIAEASRRMWGTTQCKAGVKDE